MKKIKVLHVIMSLDIGGIETLLINLLRKSDKTKYQYDFLLWNDKQSYYEEEVKKLGGNIYKINITHNPIRDIITVKKFLKEHTYDVVHAHSHFYSGFFVLAAKLAKVPIRISHMHSKSDNEKNNFKRAVYKFIAKKLMKKYSTHYLACSQEAAEYGFGKTTKKAIIINNGIDVNNYLKTDIEKVKEIKQKYNIKENDIVLGNVGHLSVEKNQIYIIEIIERLKQYTNNIKCLFVGDGDNKQNLENIIKQKALDDNIFFVGEVKNVVDYLKTMNLFLFPSLFEGFGIALLEAQAAGVYSIASNTIPQNTNMKVGLVTYLPIGIENIQLWIDEILSYKNQNVDNEKIKNTIRNRGFDLNSTLKELDKIYEKFQIDKSLERKKMVNKFIYNLIAKKLPSSENKFIGKFSRNMRARLFKNITHNDSKNLNIQKNCYFEKDIKIGDNSGIGINCLVQGPTQIGKNVMMGPDVIILTSNHKFDDINKPMIEQGFREKREVIIEDDVWIGTRAIILPGVRIGKGVVIGAGSVVTKSIPEYSVACGNPARVVKSRINNNLDRN